jgi:hypothetical protein
MSERGKVKEAPLAGWLYPSILAANLASALLAIYIAVRFDDLWIRIFVLLGAAAGLIASAGLFVGALKRYWLVFWLFAFSAAFHFLAYAQVFEKNVYRPSDYLFAAVFVVGICSTGLIARPSVQRDFRLDVAEYEGIQ